MRFLGGLDQALRLGGCWYSVGFGALTKAWVLGVRNFRFVVECRGLVLCRFF